MVEYRCGRNPDCHIRSAKMELNLQILRCASADIGVRAGTTEKDVDVDVDSGQEWNQPTRLRLCHYSGNYYNSGVNIRRILPSARIKGEKGET